MTLNIDKEYPGNVDFDYESIARQVVEAALDSENCPYEAEVSLVLTTDEDIQRTNREFREIDRVTDVLSFPMFELSPGEKPRAEWADPDTGKVFLGDMVISLERANEQAEEYGHSLERELCYLTVHSVLHLLGYDHLDEGPMKARMREREEAILAALGITREGADG